MLANVFDELYQILLSLFGYTIGSVPELVNTWLALFSLLASLFVLILPFYIVYKVVRWLCA